ncbi:hypothetical protein K7887_22160 (plasmid) [Sutcliffiella horikoshii]|uniref:hypothetical protein n=1 Tax=Sutcliffiella horikoshii TaxID=79883 RepID=UPI001CBF7032|nr:hypothetical protein [Sutcliffiella horikoshii]UAL49826.1 hypothetical protein K7887_22160 [Sutcliffiella horikoshii]
MITLEKRMENDKKNEKIERIINHTYVGEGYINGSQKVWKKVVLYHFNQVARKQISITALIERLKEVGITFNQDEKLVRYPVIDCLEYIAKISKINLDLGVE